MQLAMLMSNSSLFLSTFLFCFISFASSSSSNNSHICCPSQSRALLLFKQKHFSIDHSKKYLYVDNICRNWLGSSYYPITMNWKTSIDCCNWDGVTCNHLTGDVIDLDLSCGMLRGIIHPNSTLFHLPRLERLNLAFNDFFPSQLPHDFFGFSTSLTHINISQCGFTGQVPTNSTFLHKLVSLDLSNNLDSRLEPRVLNYLLQNSTHLRHLSLGDVHVGLVLPAYLNIPPSLKLLDLRSTGLQGKLPHNIFNLQYLEKLDLSGNIDLANQSPKVNTNTSIPLKWLSLSLTSSSSGEISASIGHLKSLNYLDLSSTNLSGVIPDTIGHLKSLDTLRLDSCDLMGPLPKSLLNLRHLTTLDLSSNKLNGTLPSWLFTLPSLEEINLNGNMFSGSLPSELFAQRSLKRLSLGYNQFVGVIDVLDHGPTLQSFQQLVNLTYLDVAHNNFSGDWELDTLLSSLRVLVVLDLSHSGLTVTTNNASRSRYVNPNFQFLELASCKLKIFPDTLRAMRKLQSLDLSRNEISGRIPDWAGEIGGNELDLDLSYNFITSLPQIQWDLHYFDIHSNLIEGPFPPAICNMSNIWNLDMSNNRFDGVIPKCLGNISSSFKIVDLGNNYFHGKIPNLPKGCGIDTLILNNNQLEGEVPSSLSECGSLIELDLHSNKIQGPFPPSICNMSNLQYLYMSDNRFGGAIPQCFENITSNPHLFMVDLGDNYFHGTIPNAIKDCGSLEWLILKGNQLEGEVPSSLAKCQSLKVLDLGNNHLNGTFPSWLGDLPLLHVLVLKSNCFYGPIRTSSAKKNIFPSLQVIDLSHNGFVGHLPRNYFQSFSVMKNVLKSSKKPTYLFIGDYYSIIVAVKGVQLNFPQILVEYTIIDLSNNKFEGEIPDEIGNLTSLIVLNLSHNKLTGQIPHALGNLLEIESLDLSWNQLIGEIPQSLVDLSFLEYLNLSQNHLMGRIPQGKQFNTFEGNSFGGNPKLCGLPLPEKCEHPHESQLEVDEDTESGFTWRVVMLGYGCGTLLGLLIGYFMLSTGKPKWFNAIADAVEHTIHKGQNKRRYVFIGK